MKKYAKILSMVMIITVMALPVLNVSARTGSLDSFMTELVTPCPSEPVNALDLTNVSVDQTIPGSGRVAYATTNTSLGTFVACPTAFDQNNSSCNFGWSSNVGYVNFSSTASTSGWTVKETEDGEKYLYCSPGDVFDQKKNSSLYVNVQSNGNSTTAGGRAYSEVAVQFDFMFEKTDFLRSGSSSTSYDDAGAYIQSWKNAPFNIQTNDSCPIFTLQSLSGGDGETCKNECALMFATSAYAANVNKYTLNAYFDGTKVALSGQQEMTSFPLTFGNWYTARVIADPNAPAGTNNCFVYIFDSEGNILVSRANSFTLDSGYQLALRMPFGSTYYAATSLKNVYTIKDQWQIIAKPTVNASGETVSASCTVSNDVVANGRLLYFSRFANPDTTSPKLICAIYDNDNGNLVGMNSVSGQYNYRNAWNSGTASSEPLTVSVSKSGLEPGTYKARAFLWKSFNKATPYTDYAEMTFTVG